LQKEESFYLYISIGLEVMVFSLNLADLIHSDGTKPQLLANVGGAFGGFPLITSG
jgi:hypothetical protein